MENAVVLWTGGKDSSLALHEARKAGYDVRSLVTFTPKEPRFLAHPLEFMKQQAEALDLPHYTLEVSEPLRENYEKAICSLRAKQGITTLITGDIAEVDGHPNWIRECSKNSGVHVLTPLWGYNRHELMRKLISNKFQVIFSCVKKPWFTIDWLGREINEDSLEELLALEAETGLDVCGEEGEYHSLVLDSPDFKKSIHIVNYSKHTEDSLMYLEIQGLSLQEK